MSNEISSQGFLNKSGLHYHYDICWIYESFYLSDGDNMVELQIDDLSAVVKAITDFGREYEDWKKNDEGKESPKGPTAI